VIVARRCAVARHEAAADDLAAIERWPRRVPRARRRGEAHPSELFDEGLLDPPEARNALGVALAVVQRSQHRT
jgi:hypothetical protein